MIPRIIHFCWFGKGAFPKIIVQCIESWKIKLPEYKIMFWNEESFDINTNEFVKKAYYEKKWAFVSDYVRLVALQKYGGIYLDTDVEILKDFSHLLTGDSFISSFTEGGLINTFFMACPPNHNLINYALSFYNHFDKLSADYIMNNYIFSALCLKHYGIKPSFPHFKNDEIQLYSLDFFAPYRKSIFGKGDNVYSHKKYRLNENTFIIHHDLGSWGKDNCVKQLMKGFIRFILPHSIYNRIKIKVNSHTINSICTLLEKDCQE